MLINGYALFIITALVIIAALCVALVAGWFILKRLTKNKKTFWVGFATLGLAVVYGIYMVAFLFLSAFDTGYGHDVGEENIAALKDGMDLAAVFAQEKAELETIRHSWGGKQCHLYFYVKEGSSIGIPPALDAYIREHPQLGSGNSLRIIVSVYGNDDAPTCEKVYFWWRMLY